MRGKWVTHLLARSLTHSLAGSLKVHYGINASGGKVGHSLAHSFASSFSCLLTHTTHSLVCLLAHLFVCSLAHLLMGKCNCMSEPHASMDNIIDNIIDSMEENCFLPFILHHRIQGGEKFCTFGIETSDSPIFPPLYQ